MNHRTAPVEIRERFAVTDLRMLLRKLVDRPEFDEAVLLSTCNRVEVIITTETPDAAQDALYEFFARDLADGELPASLSLQDMTYLRHGREAIEHVYRVASSIDSMVVGEPQILGQVKDAYRESADAGACGAVLSRLFQRAFATAKRVKNETGIAQRPVSVARVAVDLAKQIFETLADKSALLIGAGEMIEAALVALDDHGLGERRVANRTAAHAEELAIRFGGSAHGLDEIDGLLPQSDVVLTCVGGDAPILTRAKVKTSLRSRRGKPLFLIDLGVPRNIDPRVHDLDSAYLYDLDDLQEVAAANAEGRRRESERAEQIVYEEREHFEGWLVTLQAVPTIRNLRDRSEKIRQAEIDRFGGRLRLDDGQNDVLEQLTRSIVNKIMHAPISRLRDETDREAGLIRLEEARSLFALDETSDSDSLGDAPIQAASEVDLDSPLKDLHRTPGHGEPKTREEDGEEDS
jgi:glutamyl-tRNA reductase